MRNERIIPIDFAILRENALVDYRGVALQVSWGSSRLQRAIPFPLSLVYHSTLTLLIIVTATPDVRFAWLPLIGREIYFVGGDNTVVCLPPCWINQSKVVWWVN